MRSASADLPWSMRDDREGECGSLHRAQRWKSSPRQPATRQRLELAKPERPGETDVCEAADGERGAQRQQLATMPSPSTASTPYQTPNEARP
jgi:hypothetical protein